MPLPVDRLLTTVLRQYQSVHDAYQTDRIFATTTSLLATLQNPLNITLLTSHFLAAPAIWSQPDGLRTCQRIMSVYNTAAIAISKEEHEVNPARGRERTLSCDDWTRAVIKGADERSPRWRHSLVISGVLLGLARQPDADERSSMRLALERALVTAANLALREVQSPDDFGGAAVVMALNYGFFHLRDTVRASLDCDALALPLIQTILRDHGYGDGYFIGIIDPDVRQVAGPKFDWSSSSPSFQQLQLLNQKPIVSSMGSLSRFAAFAIENLSDSRLVLAVLDEIHSFSIKVSRYWRYNKLSEIDHTEETLFLTLETSTSTLPPLWQTLKGMMFGLVNVLRAAVGRTLIDPNLIVESAALSVATSTLNILRNVYFITSRLGTNTFSAHVFAYMTSIDIITAFPIPATDFLKSIAPPYLGTIPSHPLDRTLDLYFLNLSEHFTLALSPADCESLIFAAAAPYINPKAHANLLEIFEAAHSAVLALLSAPRNLDVATRIIPFYVEALFTLFPQSLSARQFRFAFKSLVQITTPPSPLSAREPLMADTLLELLRDRAVNASTGMIPQKVSSAPEMPLSEQATLAMALIDALPQLRPLSLEDWLPMTAELLNSIEDTRMRNACKARFWEVLESGEMDVERAAICVAWWTTRGGREMLISSESVQGGPFMSGGLVARDGSKL